MLRAVRSRTDVLGVLPAAAVDPTVRVLTVGGRHPLRDPRPYPLEVPAAEPAPEVTTMTVVGDVMLGRRVGRAIADDPSRTASGRWPGGCPRAEITVGNLESTLSTDGQPTQGGDSFGADPQVVRGLELAGFDLVSLANNHVGDYGDRALRQTLAGCATADLPYVGAGRNLAEARRPVVLTRDGVRIGFLATDSIGETPAATGRRAGTNRLNMPPRTGPLNERRCARITGDIRALKRDGRRGRGDPALGHPVHAPPGGQPAPRGPRLRRGRRRPGHRRPPALGAGLGAVRPTTVVHSLGNFIFDMDFQTKTREGVFVEIVLWGGEVKAVEPVPYVLDDRFTPRLARGERARGSWTTCGRPAGGRSRCPRSARGDAPLGPHAARRKHTGARPDSPLR